MNNAQHHQHLRKRMYKNLESFPSQSWYKRKLDTVIYYVGILGPLITIPQIYSIFAFHNAGGVSALSWSVYTVFSVVWLLYGLAHKEHVITINSALWIVMNGLVALGAILYG
jgi:uncharacterized protein with PQ loop repeat